MKYFKQLLTVFLLFFTLATNVLASNIPNNGIGQIETPPGVDKYQAASGADIGIIFFISNLIKVFAVVMGIWVVFNVILAGYIYLTSSGDASAHDKVRTQITNSVIGLILIVMSYTIGGLIGLLFFGDATFILNPKLPDAGTYTVGP